MMVINPNARRFRLVRAAFFISILLLTSDRPGTHVPLQILPHFEPGCAAPFLSRCLPATYKAMPLIEPDRIRREMRGIQEQSFNACLGRIFIDRIEQSTADSVTLCRRQDGHASDV